MALLKFTFKFKAMHIHSDALKSYNADRGPVPFTGPLIGKHAYTSTIR
jgi:hypothetical protein